MTENELIMMAKQYRERAYAPYSHFAVGAAVLACPAVPTAAAISRMPATPSASARNARRSAKAVSEGEREFEALAVIADSDGPCPPCGMCRQFLAEFRIPRILMADLKGNVKAVSLEELLPFSFSLDDPADGKRPAD
jgi:cytidine deaminase